MSEQPVRSVAISCTVNGSEVHRVVAARMTLAHLLREELGLTGTKISCDLQVCGACTVLVDDRPVSACTFLAADTDRHAVRTVEGLGSGDGLSPLQVAFMDNFALQCGYCTPGFLMMGTALLESNLDPTREEIIEHFEGNICRCTGYVPIVEAVLDAASHMRDASSG